VVYIRRTEVKIAIVLSIVVFVLNVLPAFAPPTWTTMSFSGLAIPNNNSMLLSLVAATAAKAGRGCVWNGSALYFSAYYLTSQLLLIPVIYTFTRLDWQRYSLRQRKVPGKPK
jgi:hypothetical protein